MLFLFLNGEFMQFDLKTAAAGIVLGLTAGAEDAATLTHNLSNTTSD